MGLHYNFISSTAAYDEFPREGCVAIEFIALLTSISYENTHYLLELQNFAQGRPDSLPYLVKMRCPDKFSEKLAKMTISLIFQCLDVELPDAVLDGKLLLNDIHLKNLCFVKCRCLYVSKESIYCVYLEKVRPLNAASVMDAALNHRNEPVGKAIFDTMQNLIKLDRLPASAFTFAGLSNQHKDFSHFIESLKPKQVAPVSNPFFAANHLASAAVDTQNEFNSQFMGSGGSFDTMGFDAIEESDSSLEPECLARKKPRLASSAIRPNTSMTRALGTSVKLCGQIAGIFPVGPDAAGDFRLYFIPHDWSPKTDAPLVANVNCLECFVDRESPLHQLLDAVFETPDAFRDILAQPRINIELKRTRWNFQGEIHSSRWTLTSFDQQQELLHRIKPSNTSQKRDPLVAFKNLTVRNHEVKYVTMMGLLVACTFENPSFVSMVFTDFTSNPEINQKFLFDRFLLDFDNKLEQDAGFRTVMYPNQFARFDAQLQDLYGGFSLRDMFMPNSGENVSHKGILCRMSLKLKLFNNKVNAIMRDCIPITATTRLFYNDEREHLQHIRTSALNTLKQPSLNRFFENYAVGFPLVRDRSTATVSLVPNHPEIPDLRLNAEDELVTCTSAEPISIVARDIAALNGAADPNPAAAAAMHRVEGQILSLELQTGSTQLHVTNELIARDYVDPARVLTLELPTARSVQAFLQGAAAENCAEVVGEECCFTVARRSVPLLPLCTTNSGRLLVWCPIECSLPELRSQLRHSQFVKREA